MKLDVHTKDEVGRLSLALNQTLDKLRTTLQTVSDSASSASTASSQLAAASEAIASGSQEQAASLEETSASLEQITATIRQSADNSRQANQLASSSRETAEAGQQVVVAQAVAAMEEINVASSKISDIISTIDEITFQTNLLTVHAAVEAARAGEEGRGFAVVATEVRTLAQRSASAAKEIKGLIQDTLKKVERGSGLVTKSGETLQTIVSSVRRVTDIVAEIGADRGADFHGAVAVRAVATQLVTTANLRLKRLVGVFTLSDGQQEQAAVAAAWQPQAAVRPTPSAPARALLH